MLFNSFEFIFLFLPITLFIFFQFGQRSFYNEAKVTLIVASLCFYGWWNTYYLGLLILSILFNYLIGASLSNRYLYQKLPINRRLLLIFGIVINLGLLAYFKYTNFLIDSVNRLIGINFNLQNIILPLAISFFTFTQIAYLVDAYRHKSQGYSFLNYCLFITFFPHLIAGPIIHHHELIPQFESKSIYKVSYENLAVGLTIFSLGLFKKVFLADSIDNYANQVFQAAAQGVNITFFDAWIGALSYTLQLYFDFSGYSDMAIGGARMFGIKFPLNFNSPYKSVNIVEFWRRWHITLSNFLRDYLYIPLGGSRKGKLRHHINLMITMLLGGLWHGAGWTFVIWGGLHGIYLVINHQWNSFLKSRENGLKQNYWVSRILACFITFLAVVFAWVFFRSDNLDTAIAIIKGMLAVSGMSMQLNINLPTAFGLICFLLGIAWFMPNTQQWLEKYNPTLLQTTPNNHFELNNLLWQKLQWKPSLTSGAIIGVIIFICLNRFLSAAESEFLYFNF